MKKFIIIALTLILCLCFIGCTKNESNASSTDNTNSINNESVDNASIVDISSQVEATEPLTEEQVKKFFEPLLANGIMVYESIDNDLGKFEYQDEIAFKTDDGNCYSLITDENFKTIDDVWEYAYSAYTKQAAKRLFSNHLDQGNTSPRFMEKDGNLYYKRAGRGHDVDFPIETMKIIKQYNEMIIVSIDYCCYNYEPKDSVFVMCKTEDGWRLANCEEEAVTVLPKQFLAQYNHSESVVFQNNSKEYTATIYFKNELSNCAHHIIITDNESNKQVQKIDLTQNEKFGDKSIYAVDVNFDGYNDLIIPHEHPANAVYFKAYIWNVSKQGFVYAPSFENIENFVLDNDNKRILSHRTASRITTYAIHLYDETSDDFLLKKLVCWQPTDDENTMHFTEEEYNAMGKSTIINDCLVNATDPVWIDESNKNVADYFVDGSFWDLNSTKWKDYFYKKS